jgi:uncharacterized membrane protein
MKERSILVILVLVLLITAGAEVYFALFYSEFTFSSSELTISNNTVHESLKFTPNKPYHTLYRNFETQVYFNESEILSTQYSLWADNSKNDYIMIKTVSCGEGTSYTKDYYNIVHSGNGVITLPYTERNEYGCGFGSIEGFMKGREYSVSAEYVLNPKTLFVYKGKYYIKFVAYSGGNHPFLIKGKNFIVSDGVLTKKYSTPNTNVIMYVPFDPSQSELGNYTLISVDSLDYGIVFWIEIIFLLLVLLPAIICIIAWAIFGKETKEGDFPEELSQYPFERKTWEVSTYFHPPFGELDENFLPAMILDFYNRKILSIQERKTGLIIKELEIFIKINPIPPKEKLDDMETKILDFLKFIESIDKSPDGFFSIKKVASGFMTGIQTKKSFEELKKIIKKKSKEHISYTGNIVVMVAVIVATIPIALFLLSDIFIYIPVVIIGFAIKKTSLFIKFKDNWYLEYQQWQGFRKYLSTLDSMKRTPPQGVVLWEKYLVYATALGVGKKVLELMKQMNVINEQTYNSYAVLYTSSAFGSFSSKGGGAGGGGGGIGGGGGGGR